MRRLRRLLLMDEHTCPWWFGYTFDNPIRGFLHKPSWVVGDYVRRGDTVADLGCGGGHFSLGLARLVGGEGRVIAIDVQDRMLRRVQKRARSRGLEGVIDLRLCSSHTLGLDEPLDFALAFWMVHEVPDQRSFLTEVGSALKPTGRFLLAEPLVHVSASRFLDTLDAAKEVGFQLVSKPRVRFSRAALFSFSGS